MLVLVVLFEVLTIYINVAAVIVLVMDLGIQVRTRGGIIAPTSHSATHVGCEGNVVLAYDVTDGCTMLVLERDEVSAAPTFVQRNGMIKSMERMLLTIDNERIFAKKIMDFDLRAESWEDSYLY